MHSNTVLIFRTIFMKHTEMSKLPDVVVMLSICSSSVSATWKMCTTWKEVAKKIIKMITKIRRLKGYGWSDCSEVMPKITKFSRTLSKIFILLNRILEGFKSYWIYKKESVLRSKTTNIATFDYIDCKGWVLQLSVNCVRIEEIINCIRNAYKIEF